MEPTVKASARHTIHVTADTWRIRLSASAHSHPNDAYARRATAISAIGSVLIDAPLHTIFSRLASSLGYEGVNSAPQLLEIFDPTTLSREPFIY